MQMQIPSNLSLGSFIFELVIGFLISILILFYGIYFVKSYVKKKEWDESRSFVLNVNVIWFILIIVLEFILLYFIGVAFLTSILFNVLKIVIGIAIITIFVWKYYNKQFTESIILTIILGVLIFALTTLLRTLIDVIRIMVTSNDQDIFGAGLSLFLTTVLILGINSFYINWGDKAQFLSHKNSMMIVTTVPAVYYLAYQYELQLDDFLASFFIHLIWGLVITLIVSIITKIAVQSSLSFEKIRDIHVLEKKKRLLEIKDLKVYYPLIGGMLKRQFGSVKAVDGVTFDIDTGETVGLVGESGCGKTTVANAILGLVPKEAGDILFNGEPIPNEYSKYLRQKIQIVFQDPDASLNPRMKVVDIIAEPLRNLLGITKNEDIRRRVLDLLDEVSLKREHMDRFPHEFSGGQKQRIIIARALASNPELVILDEPTSALDVSVQAQILNLLKRLQKTYGYGFLFITHNLAVVNHIADRVAVMYLGKFVEVGETEQIFSNPTHPYTQALLASRTELNPKNKEISFVIKGEVPSPIAPPPGCTFNPRCISDAKTKECTYETPQKIKIEDGHYIWCVNPPVWMQKQASTEKGISKLGTLEN